MRQLLSHPTVRCVAGELPRLFHVYLIRLYKQGRVTPSNTEDVSPGVSLRNSNKLCARPPQYAPAPCKLTFDLLTLKVVSESRVTWPTSVPILVFLGLSVLDIGPMYATDRQTSDVRRASSLNAPYPRGGGIMKETVDPWRRYAVY